MKPWRVVVLMLLVGTVVSAQHGLGLSGAAGVERLRSLVVASAPYGPLVFITACITGIVLQLPPLLPIAAGGLVFEGLHAVAYGWVASLVGTTATFLVVRYVAREPAQRMLAERFGRLRALDERLERHGFATVLVLRLLLCLSPPLTWALGASRVRLHHFVAGTALGALPGLVAAVLLAGVLANGTAAAPAWTARTIVGGIAVVGILATAAVAGRRLLGQGGAPGI